MSVRNLEGFFKLLSKDFSFPDIEDLSGNDPPEKSLFAPVVSVFSGRKAALNAEEENNSKKLEGFSDAVEYIFIKCGLLESDKNEVAISVKSVDDIPGSSSEKNLMDLFIDYYAYLISNNEIKYVKKSYKELKFNCLQTSKGPGDFSLKKYNIMRDTIKGIIDWYPNYLLEEAAGKYKYGESTLAEMSNILSLGVCDYLKKNCSQASNEERGKILEEFVGDIDFNIRIKIAKTEVSRKTHVETLDYKRKIRSAMLEYNGCSDKNPEVTRFLRFMALAVYAESLEMKKWLTYTDLQEFLRQFKPKASS
ncbi:hypothetical protein [Paraburkholderia bonniea]|uniref:hypothetical protein n=1 Tax=Paraburkholderia bonniea TaxID=2152891 RepID=UPI001292608F|nr:hypothetical protein [Paraburkholderia bonniea]